MGARGREQDRLGQCRGGGRTRRRSGARRGKHCERCQLLHLRGRRSPAGSPTGTSMCFATVANVVMGSVPPTEAGIASGTNSALREFGGVFGVAVLAAAFTHQGSMPHPRHSSTAFSRRSSREPCSRRWESLLPCLRRPRTRPDEAPVGARGAMAFATEPECGPAERCGGSLSVLRGAAQVSELDGDSSP